MAFNYVSFGLLTSDVVGLTEEQRTSLEFQMTVSITDESTWLYRNFRFPRYQNFYGYAQVMSGAYVIESIPLQYLNQEIVFFTEDQLVGQGSLLCAVKDIITALGGTPPVAQILVLSRKRITSVRFRLFGGIRANCGIRWQTYVPQCGETVVQPNPKQGTPVPPNNASSNPADRPTSQGGDPSDHSNNDGDYNPGDGHPQPPIPGVGSGVWKFSYTGYDANGTRYSGTSPLASSNPSDIITFSVVDGPGGNRSGHQDKVVTFFINGADAGIRPSGFDLNITNVYYG